MIRSRLVGGNPVSSKDLAVEFSVSEDAIRRDLRMLAAEGVCQRVYGGALPLSPASTPIVERMEDNAAEKTQLAICALSLLGRGATVFLDSSSTNLHLARQLPEGLGIRIVTNSVPIAAAMIGKPGIETDIIGGRVNAHVGGRVDAGAITALADYSIDLCFIGACAYDRTEGLAGFDRDDVAIKRALIAKARSIAILLTTDKLGTYAPYHICQPAKIGTYVLSADAPQPMRDELASVAQVIVAQRNVKE